MKISKIEISATDMAYNLYVSGHGITHAVRMANAKVADLFKMMHPEKNMNPDYFANVHNVAYRAKKAGVVHHYAKSYNPDAIRKMKKDYEGGKTMAAIAKQYGISTTTVFNYLKTEY